MIRLTYRSMIQKYSSKTAPKAKLRGIERAKITSDTSRLRKTSNLRWCPAQLMAVSANLRSKSRPFPKTSPPRFADAD